MMLNFDSNINRLKSQYYLNRAIKEAYVLVESYPNISNLLLEEENGGPHYEWDLINNKFYDRVNNIESDIAKSASSVKTSEQAIAYLKDLLRRIAELPDAVKSRLVKSAIASILTFMTLQSMVNFNEKVEKINIPNKNAIVTMVNNKIDKIKSIKQKVQVTTPKTYSNKLIDSLKNEEGIGGKPVLTAYDLGDGAYTIGYGHAVFADPSRGDNGGNYDFLPKYDKIVPGKTTINNNEAEILLRDDVSVASDALNRLFNEWKSKDINPKITQPMYDAMVSMIYNMGIDNFRKSEFIQLVKRGKFNDAAEAIKSTSSQMFKAYPGLIDRRARESQMFKSGLN